MTGFGRSSFEADGYRYRVELRSVNSRFLDIRTRLPWSDAKVDSLAVARIREALARGRVELNVQEEGGTQGAEFRLNEPVAHQIAQVLQQLASVLGSELETAARLIPPTKELLSGRPNVDADTLWAALAPAIDEALSRLLEMREAEGDGLALDLRRHLTLLEQHRLHLSQATAGEPDQIRDRLTERVEGLGAQNLEPQRLAQEVAVLAERCDVSEELARLRIHSEHLLKMFDSADPMGRKVEFLLQELNREVNTIASKTTNAEVALLVVDVKGVLERMREQAQNVE